LLLFVYYYAYFNRTLFDRQSYTLFAKQHKKTAKNNPQAKPSSSGRILRKPLSLADKQVDTMALWQLRISRMILFFQVNSIA